MQLINRSRQKRRLINVTDEILIRIQELNQSVLEDRGKIRRMAELSDELQSINHRFITKMF